MNTVLNVSNLIYNSDNIDDAIIECIDARLDGNDYPLTESIELIPELSEYALLIESVDKVVDVKKEIKNIKNEKDPEKINGIFDRLIKSVKDVFNWWYKVDPDKKYKTLHTVLKVLFSVLSIILIFWGPSQGALVKNIASKLPIGYEGPNKILSFFLSKMRIASVLIGVVYAQILQIIHKLGSKAEYRVNEKDIDKSIAEYDKAIDAINDSLDDVDDPQIKNQLNKTKKNIEQALAELIRIKEKNMKKEKKKNS